MTKETLYTLAFLLLTILMVAVSNYGLQSTKWTYIVFPDRSKNTLKEALPNIKYLASTNEEYNSVIAYIESDEDRLSLIKKGAILLDPQGIPLCLNGE